MKAKELKYIWNKIEEKEMKNIINKILVGVSLATTLALAIPVGFMTASVVRGESPRQVASREAVEDVAEEDPIENEPIQQPEDIKPEVQPDPRTAPQAVPEEAPEAPQEPEAAAESHGYAYCKNCW